MKIRKYFFIKLKFNQGRICCFRIEENKLVCAISRKSTMDAKTSFSICEVLNLLLGRNSFSGMLKVVLSEPPFRAQPYGQNKLEEMLGI